MKTFLGRQVVETSLTDIPREMRALPGCIAMNHDEVDAIVRNGEDDSAVIKSLMDIALAENMADALLKDRKVPKRPNRRLSPSVRMAMLATVVPGHVAELENR